MKTTGSSIITRRSAVRILYVLAAAVAISCGRKTVPEDFGTIYYSPEKAGGFEIVGYRDSLSRVIRVKMAWQGADSTSSELFIARNGEMPPKGFTGQVIYNRAERIAAMSSSYVAMLDLIGKTETVKAVSGIRFITNSYIREHRDSITDIGNEANADFEKLASVSPDLVLLYGISASSAMEDRLRTLGIPYLYMGEYLEPDPLGRAEWIVALAEVTGCVEKGKEAFMKISERYGQVRKKVQGSSERPKVMLNVPYGDIWYMASRGTAMAGMIRDAGAEYVYTDNSSNRSLPVDIEEALIMASDADFWLNTGQFRSIGELISAYPEFAGTKSIRKGNVYNCDRRLGPDGGNDFWESGQVRPDLVLEDLVRIFHPEAFGQEGDNGMEYTYYRKLKP